MKTCNVCKGRGQTKNSRTEFHFEKRKRADGREYQQYITDKQGSGCHNCLGRGVVSK